MYTVVKYGLEHEDFALQRNVEGLFRKRRVIAGDMSSSTNITMGLKDLANPNLSFDFFYFCVIEMELSSYRYCVVWLHKQEK